MAKRGVKPGTPSWRRFRYEPELLADWRRRYEETPEAIAAIAREAGLSARTVARLAADLGWTRRAAPPLDLPPAVKLAREAEALLAAQASRRHPEVAASPAPAPDSALAPQDDGEKEGDATPDLAARLQRALTVELGAVEAMRAQLGRTPQTPIDAQRTAQTLGLLTNTLHHLQRLKAATPNETRPDAIPSDDTPADIDALRDDLARRIAAFMESRPDTGDDAPADATSAGAT